MILSRCSCSGEAHDQRVRSGRIFKAAHPDIVGPGRDLPRQPEIEPAAPVVLAEPLAVGSPQLPKGIRVARRLDRQGSGLGHLDPEVVDISPVLQRTRGGGRRAHAGRRLARIPIHIPVGIQMVADQGKEAVKTAIHDAGAALHVRRTTRGDATQIPGQVKQAGPAAARFDRALQPPHLNGPHLLELGTEIDVSEIYGQPGTVFLEVSRRVMHPIHLGGMGEGRLIPAHILAVTRWGAPESQQARVRIGVRRQQVGSTGQLGQRRWIVPLTGFGFAVALDCALKVPIGNQRPGDGLGLDTVMGGEKVRNDRVTCAILQQGARTGGGIAILGRKNHFGRCAGLRAHRRVCTLDIDMPTGSAPNIDQTLRLVARNGRDRVGDRVRDRVGDQMRDLVHIQREGGHGLGRRQADFHPDGLARNDGRPDRQVGQLQVLSRPGILVSIWVSILERKILLGHGLEVLTGVSRIEEAQGSVGA